MDAIPGKHGRILLGIIGGLVAAGVIILLVIWGVRLSEPDVLAQFQVFIQSLGFGGGLLLFIVQYVQIVIAFIPGGPIQLVAGALFGLWGGIGICLGGMLLATATVFALVQRYGQRVIRLFLKEKDIRQYKFLQDEQRLEKLVFFLFLIPGAPKDVLTYLFALTPIPLTRFMLISTMARIPAAMTSVVVGDSVADGQWLRALVFFFILTAISLLGLLAQRKLMAFYHKNHH